MNKNIFKILILFIAIILSGSFFVSSVNANNGLILEKTKDCDIQYMGDSCIVEMKVTNNTGKILDGEAVFSVECNNQPFDGIGIYPFFSINNSDWINFYDWQDSSTATSEIFAIPQGENTACLKIKTHSALCPGQYDFVLNLKGMTEEGEEYTAAVIIGGGGGYSPSLTILGESVKITGIEETSVIIIWTTSYFSTSQVIYSAEGEPHILDLTDNVGAPPTYGYAYTTSEFDTNPKVTSHSVTITDLLPGTIYYYRTVSRASPPTISNEHSFTTLEEKEAVGVIEKIEEFIEEGIERIAEMVPGGIEAVSETEEIVASETEGFVPLEEGIGAEGVEAEGPMIPQQMAAIAMIWSEISRSAILTILVILLLAILILIGIREWRRKRGKRLNA